MRKVILFNMVTLDGFFEGPDRDINWHNVDDEFNEFAIEQINTVDTLIFGRVTYELMASYWPTKEAITNDPIVADKMNSMPKIVFSKTLASADWQNTRLVKGDAAKEIAKLKKQSGKDLIIFGSADLAASFIKDGLIDEFRVMLNPVVLGKGAPLFKDIQDKLNLKLLKTRTFGSGNVLLYYQRDGK
jgi:dihydrofolate reductase